jgi:hypothetical protein
LIQKSHFQDKNVELSLNVNSSDFGAEVDVSSSAGANPSALPSILADKFRTPVIDSLLLQQYQDILKMVLVDGMQSLEIAIVAHCIGVISAAEVEMLAEFRERNELSLEHHKKALEAIGFREDWYVC